MKIVSAFLLTLFVSAGPALAQNPDSVVINGGDLKINQGFNLVFGDNSVQTTATLQGPQGVPGIKGDTGAQGIQGVQGPPGPAGAGLSWVNVTLVGLQQAVSGTGYLANSTGLVSIKLPVSPAIGDTVRVSGGGSGGWSITQNSGQTVLTQNIPGAIGAIWTPRGNSSGQWKSIASSADGSKLVAVAQGNQIYTSADSGVTWTGHGLNAQWWSVASSADGSKLVAVVDGGQIYTSTDSGASWTPRDSARNWASVASSNDGSKLVVRFNNKFTNKAVFAMITPNHIRRRSWHEKHCGLHWYSLMKTGNCLPSFLVL